MASSKVILLTGASRGVGHAIARFLIMAPAGNRVILVSRTAEPLEELKAKAPERVDYITGDLNKPSFIQETVKFAIDKFGKLDGVILNHGTLGQVKRISELEMEDWQDCFDTNFFSAAYLAKCAIPELRKTKGRIIITSSGAAMNGYQGWGIYGATKAAQNHLTLTLAREETDITTLAVRPGMVDTDMQRQIREDHASSMDPNDVKKFTDAYEQGKLVKPEQCGHVIAKLSVYAPAELSGQFLSWDDEKLADFQMKKR